MRKFKNGAIRDDDDDKLQFTRCFSPIVLIRVAEFLRRNNQTADGRRREDNWKKGFSREAYLESKGRHFIETWLIEEGLKEYPDLKNTEDITDVEIEELLESLCAEFFNTHGFIHLLLLEQRKRRSKKKKVGSAFSNVDLSDGPNDAYIGMQKLKRAQQKKPIHYYPRSRREHAQGTICGLVTNITDRTTWRKIEVTCKTCLKIINRKSK